MTTTTARTVSTENDPHGTAMLTDQELQSMSGGFCPDCAHRGFRLGPRGGATTNIQCGGCEQPFNVTTLGWSVVMGHRLPRDPVTYT
jgi:hypothetical protein